mgnify:CR=1 FL=1
MCEVFERARDKITSPMNAPKEQRQKQMHRSALRHLGRVWSAVESWEVSEGLLTVHLRNDTASLRLLQASRAVVNFVLEGLGEQASRISVEGDLVGVVTSCGDFDLHPSELLGLRLTYVV